MTTFKILSNVNGSQIGTVKATSRDEAENKCLDKNINIYDDYMVVLESEKVYPGSPYINDILEY